MFSSRQLGPRPISLPASTGSGSGMVVVILLLLVGMGRSHLGAQDRQLKLKSPGSPPLTARATFTDQPIKIDGKLDEEAWKQAQVLKDFIQNQPRTGEPASEPTEVRILFDNDNLYFGAFCFDSEISKRTVPSLERDFSPGPLHDLFAFALDTFHDGRNSYGFAVNPPGAKHEGQFYNDGRVFNVDFDAVWHVATTVGKDRWTAEFAIPFSSMRFKKGAAQTWGINFLRVVRRKGETSFWAQLPYRYSLGRVSRAGTLVGIEECGSGSQSQDHALCSVAIPVLGPTGKRNHNRHRGWSRCQVRSDQRTESGSHLQHRFFRRRGRHPAGQPDSLQPLLPRETPFLPREPRVLFLRSIASTLFSGPGISSNRISSKRSGISRS